MSAIERIGQGLQRKSHAIVRAWHRGMDCSVKPAGRQRKYNVLISSRVWFYELINLKFIWI